MNSTAEQVHGVIVEVDPKKQIGKVAVSYHAELYVKPVDLTEAKDLSLGSWLLIDEFTPEMGELIVYSKEIECLETTVRQNVLTVTDHFIFPTEEDAEIDERVLFFGFSQVFGIVSITQDFGELLDDCDVKKVYIQTMQWCISQTGFVLDDTKVCEAKDCDEKLYEEMKSMAIWSKKTNSAPSSTVENVDTTTERPISTTTAPEPIRSHVSENSEASLQSVFLTKPVVTNVPKDAPFVPKKEALFAPSSDTNRIRKTVKERGGLRSTEAPSDSDEDEIAKLKAAANGKPCKQRLGDNPQQESEPGFPKKYQWVPKKNLRGTPHEKISHFGGAIVIDYHKGLYYFWTEAKGMAVLYKDNNRFSTLSANLKLGMNVQVKIKMRGRDPEIQSMVEWEIMDIAPSKNNVRSHEMHNNQIYFHANLAYSSVESLQDRGMNIFQWDNVIKKVYDVNTLQLTGKILGKLKENQRMQKPMQALIYLMEHPANTTTHIWNIHSLIGDSAAQLQASAKPTPKLDHHSSGRSTNQYPYVGFVCSKPNSNNAVEIWCPALSGSRVLCEISLLNGRNIGHSIGTWLKFSAHGNGSALYYVESVTTHNSELLVAESKNAPEVKCNIRLSKNGDSLFCPALNAFVTDPDGLIRLLDPYHAAHVTLVKKPDSPHWETSCYQTESEIAYSVLTANECYPQEHGAQSPVFDSGFRALATSTPFEQESVNQQGSSSYSRGNYDHDNRKSQFKGYSDRVPAVNDHNDRYRGVDTSDFSRDGALQGSSNDYPQESLFGRPPSSMKSNCSNNSQYEDRSSGRSNFSDGTRGRSYRGPSHLGASMHTNQGFLRDSDFPVRSANATPVNNDVSEIRTLLEDALISEKRAIDSAAEMKCLIRKILGNQDLRSHIMDVDRNLFNSLMDHVIDQK